MIICYESNGFVRMTVQEPIDAGYSERLMEHGMMTIRVDDDHFGDGNLLGFYVDLTSGQVLARPTFPGMMDKTEVAADDVDIATMSGIPAGVAVMVDGQPATPDNGYIEIASSMPADYVLMVDHFPYLPWTATVKAR